jgi:hypothetical protein
VDLDRLFLEREGLLFKQQVVFLEFLGIEIRGASVAAEIVKTPFYKRAK